MAAEGVFFDVSPSLMVVLRAGGVIERVNPALGKHLGYPPESMAGLPILDFLHPDDAAPLTEQLSRVAPGESLVGLATRTVARDGRISWVEFSAAALPARDEIFCCGVDITQRRKTEQALRDSEQRFRELAENVSEVFWLADARLRFMIYASPAFEPIWGRRVSDLLQDRSQWIGAIHPDDRPHAEQAFRHLIEAGDMDVEYRIIRPDGSERWIHDRAYPVMSNEGGVHRVAGLASDITDRKQTQEVLQSVALGTASASTGGQFFQNLMQHVCTALRTEDAWLMEPGDSPGTLRVIAWWSQGQARPETQLTIDELPGLEVMSGQVRSVAHGAGRLFPGTLLDQREAYVAVPLVDAAGVVQGALSVARNEPLEKDLATVHSILHIFAARATAEMERLRAQALAWKREEELAHVGRLQTMGEMATGIAHELNQPLLAIMNHAAAARLGLGPSSIDTVERDLTDIEVQAERAASIIHRLRSFVQRHPPEWAPVDLNEVVQDVLQFVATQSTRLRATIDSELSADLPTTLVDRVMLQQVLVNLITNACEAMGDLPEDDRRVLVTTQALNDAIIVAVDDHGPGPAAGTDPFEPFVSSKVDGLGIGLSISRSIIERHRGHIWHEIRIPRGCRFAFRLPVETGPTPPALSIDDRLPSV